MLVARHLVALSIFVLAAAPVGAREAGDAERGAYVLRMGGCATCHTAKDGEFLAGGRELKTAFGSFYTPNITPDPETGIGGWSTADFVRAMHEGTSPDGDPYYPSFPYTSYTRMSRADVIDLKAYLDSLEPVRNPVRDHGLDFPYNIRPAMRAWKLLFFGEGRFEPDPSKSDAWNRGAYLVTGPSHCGECHTPRNFLGALRTDRALSGARDGPDGNRVPAIDDSAAGIGDWSIDDIVFALQIGLLPDGDVVGGAMADVVEDSTGKLSEDDLRAIATYLKDLPPASRD